MMSTLSKIGHEPVHILYINYRDETDVRHIHPQDKEPGGSPLWFGSTKWHPRPQWLLHAVDIKKGEARDFAMSGILAWGQEMIDLVARDLTAREGLRVLHAALDAMTKARAALAAAGPLAGHERSALGLTIYAVEGTIARMEGTPR